ncbi:MAG: AMP-binding protein [Planctomycetota bacterium]
MNAPRTVPAYFQAALERLGDRPILEDRAGTVALSVVLSNAAAAAHGLAGRGLRRGERVGFWADNSRRWIQCDLAIQLAGAIGVPRGTDTPEAEILEIFRHADVAFVVVQDARTAARFEAVRGGLPGLREVIVLDAGSAPVPGVPFDRLVEEGRGGPGFAALAAALAPDDVSTIIYTSGTTGRPKGVVLTQGNFAHQLEVIPAVLDIGPTDVFLSVLPPWHIFERTVEYVALTQGARLVYTDVRRFRNDLAEKSPTFVPSVPRIWEAVHDAIRKTLAEGPALRRAVFASAYAVADARARAVDVARGWSVDERGRGPGLASRGGSAVVAGLLWPFDALLRRVAFRRLARLTGGRLRGAVVGGGLMPPHVDRFFRAVGVGVLVGYGLTETSPVLTVRRAERNVLRTIGLAIPGVELQVRDATTGAVLPTGETGVVFTRGPQVMRGYHRDAELTARVLDAGGWFDTGDLGLLGPSGDLLFRGRQKETIVLAGGENVEPTRVEAAITPSPLVHQVVVVGQDRKTLAALVVPERDAVVARLGLPTATTLADLAAKPEVAALLKDELTRRTGSGSGLRPFEHVARVAVLGEVLSGDNACLTATLKVRRHEVVKRFAKDVEAAYAG